jgi:5-(carboxyamino)imidazole ribonucleotide mutase
MPKGIPVATFAIGEPGAANSALFAISILSNENNNLKDKLISYRKSQTHEVLNKKLK